MMHSPVWPLPPPNVLDHALDSLYGDLALPTPPMHLFEFLAGGGTSLATCTLDHGRVVDMSAAAKMGLVRRALREGPEVGLRRGARVPLMGDAATLAKEILGEATPPEVAGIVWMTGARELERTGAMPHADRFRLLMSMLRAGWTDEQVHGIFRHATNYQREKTQRFIQHARGRYL